jgi:hypothetical protein
MSIPTAPAPVVLEEEEEIVLTTKFTGCAHLDTSSMANCFAEIPKRCTVLS